MSDECWEIDDDEPEFWEDDYDDEDYGPPKQEPNCHTCYDTGIEERRGKFRECRGCRPSRLRAWAWNARFRLRLWVGGRRARRAARRGEPPF